MLILWTFILLRLNLYCRSDSFAFCCITEDVSVSCHKLVCKKSFCHITMCNVIAFYTTHNQSFIITIHNSFSLNAWNRKSSPPQIPPTASKLTSWTLELFTDFLCAVFQCLTGNNNTWNIVDNIQNIVTKSCKFEPPENVVVKIELFHVKPEPVYIENRRHSPSMWLIYVIRCAHDSLWL